ncbi:MAG TPA: PQQ-binding-like beta-propeller repeat protein [Planctomycetota bacterium]
MAFLLLHALSGVEGLALQDWDHWRGPNRDGIVAEPSGWGAPGWPGEPAWSANLGAGSGSPLVVQGRLYAMGWAQDRDQVLCLDAASGKELWKASYPSPSHGRHHMGDEQFYSGPTATPEFDAGRLYTLGADGDLLCWDAGRKVWGFNLYDVYKADRRPHVGAERRDYGYITAPLVHGDALLVHVGAAEGTVMAFAKDTGKRLWTSECKDPAGHTGGMAPMTVEGVPCVATLTLRNLVVLRLDDGRTVATYPWTTDFGNNIASPAVVGDSVLITSEYNRSAICRLRITLKGASKVWEAPYASKACTPVVYQDRVYWAWRKVRCLDFATGVQKWEGGAFGDAGSCIATSDGKLIVWGGTGRLALLETGDAYKELFREPRVFSATAWPHVTLAGGRLYCKDRDGNLKCFQVR